MILSEQQVAVEASIGAAIFPEDGRDFSDLVEHARSAMQQAKSIEGGRFIRYSDKLTFDIAGNSSLAAELRTAVRKNQFELHYQPRIDLNSGRLVGLEALLRWNHPERGLIAPGMRADLNLIDFDALALPAPEMVYDLPASGQRLIQRADGYVATMLRGAITFEHGESTGALPGRLVRGRQAAP